MADANNDEPISINLLRRLHTISISEVPTVGGKYSATGRTHDGNTRRRYTSPSNYLGNLPHPLFQCWMIVSGPGRAMRLGRRCEATLKLGVGDRKHTHAHAHTHTQRERERERPRNPNPELQTSPINGLRLDTLHGDVTDFVAGQVTSTWQGTPPRGERYRPRHRQHVGQTQFAKRTCIGASSLQNIFRLRSPCIHTAWRCNTIHGRAGDFSMTRAPS